MKKKRCFGENLKQSLILQTTGVRKHHNVSTATHFEVCGYSSNYIP